jgi:replicative DNA helicase Mcm
MSETPIEISISKIGAKNFGKRILCRGVIISTSKVQDVCIEACFVCGTCGTPNLILQETEELVEPDTCNKCRKAVKFVFDAENSVFDDYQELVIQELQQDIPSGRIPKTIEIKLLGEQTNTLKAGDEISLIGYVKHFKPKKGSLVFEPYILAEEVTRLNKIPEDIIVSEDDKVKIVELSQNPVLYDVLVETIAPHLRGLRKEKEAIMYAIFGGVSTKEIRNRKRGDINVLLVGDPSVGKSELLMSVTRIVPRGIFTSGQGSSAAGLTATVTKNSSGKWVLEAGALILGDKGIVCIDEIEKMKTEDRQSIHVAMEQQKIPINKAGINTVLDARNTIIAACNPTFMYYDDERTIAENIKLDSALLTRFDLIFVMRDTPNEKADSKVFDFILNIDKDIDNNIVPLDEDFMKKYISYAKRVKPVITSEAQEIIAGFAKEMRQRGKKTSENVIFFSYRLVQGLMRITEARARIRLSNIADDKDARYAIDIMKQSLNDVGLVENSIAVEAVKTVAQRKQALINIISDLARGKSGGVETCEIVAVASERMHVSKEDVERLLFSLEEKDRKVYQPTINHYKPVYDIDRLFSG